jgi:hypothetical protein
VFSPLPPLKTALFPDEVVEEPRNCVKAGLDQVCNVFLAYFPTMSEVMRSNACSKRCLGLMSAATCVTTCPGYWSPIMAKQDGKKDDNNGQAGKYDVTEHKMSAEEVASKYATSINLAAPAKSSGLPAGEVSQHPCTSTFMLCYTSSRIRPRMLPPAAIDDVHSHD